MSRILVTGAAGFIGSHLLPVLRAAGHDVIAVSSAAGDVAEQSTWAALPAAACVVHLAARSFVPDSWREPGEFMRTNLLGTTGALEYCRMHGARLVFLSSYMYGTPDSLPIHETAPLVARNPYALSKKLAEDVCRFYAERLEVDVTVLRPFNVYGPRQAELFLVPFLVRQVREGVVIRVQDLAPRRDYVYIEDVVAGILRAVEGLGGFRVFNLGSGRSHSVEELIVELQRVAGTALPVVSDEERRKDEVMDTVADISEAERYLGWIPRFSLREGLEDLLRVERAGECAMDAPTREPVP